MQLVYLTIQGENQCPPPTPAGLWLPFIKTASVQSKAPYVHGEIDTPMTNCHCLFNIKGSISNIFYFSELFSAFYTGVSCFCNYALLCFHKGAGLILLDSCL